MSTETNDQYHADTARKSNSMLSVLKKSPQEFQGRYVTMTMPHPLPTPAMMLGHGVHCLSLEPGEYHNRFIVMPKMDRRTNAGKAAYEEFLSIANGKEVIEKADADTAKACAMALLKHDQIGPLLSKNAIIETRINFVCNDVAMRCKPDWVCPDMKLILDVKTTSDASPGGFAKSIASFGYARQAALYRDAVAFEHGIDCRFLFAVVCTNPPYEVACYELTDEAIYAGQEEAVGLLDEYKARCESNNWLPAWSSGIVPIGLPRWYKHEIFEVAQ
jgi:exodeoxyribonuclease VIII